MTDTPNSRSALWSAVIDQAIRDATCNVSSVLTRVERNHARRWLTTPSADFAEVCGLAGYEPDRVRAAALDMIERADSGEPARAPRASKPAIPKTLAMAPTLPPARRLRPIIDAPSMHFPAGRKAKRYTHNGLSLSLTQWANRLGIGVSAIHNRLASGWSIERALTEPMSERALAHRNSFKRNRAQAKA